MTELLQIDSYGTLIGPNTLQMKRLLPGPIERVWDYLVVSELRRQWLASGDDGRGGSAFRAHLA